jgi:hypothetical protein
MIAFPTDCVHDVGGVTDKKSLAAIASNDHHSLLVPFEHGEHYMTIPRHESLRVGTLAEVLIWHLRPPHFCDVHICRDPSDQDVGGAERRTRSSVSL